MRDNDGFLARWSRRKLHTPEPSEAADQRDTSVPAPPEPGPGEPEQTLSAEELARLPRVEDLTAETDLGQFLRQGVPEFLKRAALRRIWSLDPAIRDFPGDARDYAYDWNLPGSVPGSGPILPSDDIKATLSRMFDRPSGEPDGGQERARAKEPPGSDTPPDPEPPQASAEAAAEGEGARATADCSGAQEGEVAPALPSNPAARRRHGGAVPT